MATTKKTPAPAPYLITTAHRGVFAGLVDPATINQDTLRVEGAKMAIRFGTTKGVMELAHTGPTSDSRISAPADIEALHNVTGVFAITDAAWAAWCKA